MSEVKRYAFQDIETKMNNKIFVLESDYKAKEAECKLAYKNYDDALEDRNNTRLEANRFYKEVVRLTAINKTLLEACAVVLTLNPDDSYEEWMENEKFIESAIQQAKEANHD